MLLPNTIKINDYVNFVQASYLNNNYKSTDIFINNNEIKIKFDNNSEKVDENKLIIGWNPNKKRHKRQRQKPKYKPIDFSFLDENQYSVVQKDAYGKLKIHNDSENDATLHYCKTKFFIFAIIHHNDGEISKISKSLKL